MRKPQLWGNIHNLIFFGRKYKSIQPSPEGSLARYIKTLRMCEFYDSAILFLENFSGELIGQLSKDVCIRMFVAGWFT